MTKEYSNGSITVLWDAERCVHSGNCVSGLPAVFGADKRPWINVDGAGANAIAQAVTRCPSGALHFRRPDRDGEEPASETVVTATDFGALYLGGDIEVRGADGAPVRKDTRVALCGCGHSGSSPFCDATCRAASAQS